MNKWLTRAKQNPKTSIVGLAKAIVSLWFIWVNRSGITPDQLMHPEGFIPVVILVSAIGDLLSADAKDEIKARDVGPNTTVIGEK